MKTYILLLLVVFDPNLIIAQSGCLTKNPQMKTIDKHGRFDPASGYLTRHHQITMGKDASEIYLSTYWYPHEYDSLYETILYSNDNGLSFSIKNNQFIYTYPLSRLFGDNTAGVVYKCPDWAVDTFSVSFDTGMTLNKKYFHNPVDPASGCLPGEIYFQTYLSGPVLCRSTDYGSSFDTISLADSIYLLDVGVTPGELYFMGYGNDTTINIVTTLDYGVTYQSHQIPVPSFITYCFTKGPSPGEFYLLVYDTPYNEFHIYHAIDYGNIVTYQSHHENCSVYFTSYTAGRQPGTFYVARRSTYDPYLYIDYSTDYGVTFTTYVHYLDSTYTGVAPAPVAGEIILFPNPAIDLVTITSTHGPEIRRVEVWDHRGMMCRDLDIPGGSNRIAITTGMLPRGLYLVRVIPKNGRATVKKVVLE